MTPWLTTALAIPGGLILLWLLALAALALVRPRGSLLTKATRLRLIPRLAMPLDLMPDFIPVLGHADGAIVVAAALRSVVGHAGPDALARHWPGTPAVRRLAGLPATTTR